MSRAWISISVPIAIALLACSEDATTAVPEQPVEYVAQQEALRGLTRIHLNPSFANVREQSLAMPADLAEKVERRLQAAGLELIEAEDLEENPGLAEMQIYPTSDGDGSAGMAEGPSCCRANVWISVLEGTSLDRAPDIHQRLPVWGSGSHESCVAEPADAGELILQVVDRFVADLRSANAEEDALAASDEEPRPDARRS